MDGKDQIPPLYKKFVDLLVAENFIPEDAVPALASRMEEARLHELYRGTVSELGGIFDDDVCRYEGPWRADKLEAVRDGLHWWLQDHADNQYHDIIDADQAASAVASALAMLSVPPESPDDADVKVQFVKNMTEAVDGLNYVDVEYFTAGGAVEPADLVKAGEVFAAAMAQTIAEENAIDSSEAGG